MSRGDLTDAEWAALESLLPVSNNRCGRWRDHRQVINGIIHRLGTGVQWRELPERFGPWKTVHKRHLRWSADGTWERLLHHVQAVTDAVERHRLGHRVDSTSSAPMQHARPVHRGTATGPGDRVKGGRSAKTSHEHAQMPARRGWRRWCTRRGPGPLARRADQQGPPESDGSAARCPCSSPRGQRADCTQFSPCWTRSASRAGARAGRDEARQPSARTRLTATEHPRLPATPGQSSTSIPEKSRHQRRPLTHKVHAAGGHPASTPNAKAAQDGRTGREQVQAFPGRGNSL